MTILQLELFKIKKSMMIKIVALALMLIPMTAVFFTLLLQHPTMMDTAGLLGDKAKLLGDSTGASLIHIQTQMIAVGGIIAYGFVITWVFGREYVDRTITDLFVLPYPRTWVVLAKFLASFITNILLTIFVIVVGLLLGWLIRIEDLSFAVIIEHLPSLIFVSLFINLLSTPIAFFASIGRGYMLSFGVIIFILIFSQILAAIGMGAYFPWSMISLYSGVSGEAIPLNFTSMVILVVTILLGMMSTLIYYVYADLQ